MKKSEANSDKKKYKGPVSRIIARYVIGYMLLGSTDIGSYIGQDPDVIMLIASGLGVICESSYILARRWGWAT